MTSALGELVTLTTSTDRHLDGIYFGARTAATGTVVHIHGSCGNFYHNRFIRVMARYYQEASVAFLSFNLSAHDGLAEGYVGVDDFEYVGGAVAGFGTALADIDAAVEFARRRTEGPVVLQGHSLGCDRVLAYLATRGCALDFVLLSPCDSYELHRRWISPETIEHQLMRLRSSSGASNTAMPSESDYLDSSLRRLDWLPLREYGVRASDWAYPIPITRMVLLELIEGPAFKLLRLDVDHEFVVKGHGLVYMGGRDSIQTFEPEAMFAHVERHARSVQRVFIEEGDHGLAGCEEAVVTAILDWWRQRNSGA
jgi:hypothetical protein